MNILMRVFLAGAIGTAIGYLSALRFNSVIGVLVGAVMAAIICDPITLKIEIKNAIERNKARRQKYLALKGVGVSNRIVIPEKVLVFLFSALAFLFGMIIVIAFLMKVAHADFAGAVIGTLILWMLGMCSGAFIFDDTKAYALGVRFPIARKITNSIVNLTQLIEDNTPSLSQGVKKLFVYKIGLIVCSFLLPSAITMFSCLMIWCGVVICSVAAIELPFAVVIYLSKTKAIGAGIGALVASTIEYFAYSTVGVTTTDIVRFMLFMIFGGLLGVGAYILHDKLYESATSPEQVQAT